MNPKKLFIVEQYLSWNGHYKRYLDCLVSDKYHYIYSSLKPLDYPNAIFLPATEENNKGNFIDFVKGRFINSYKAYKKLVEQNADAAHILEFEPFSFLYLLLFKRKQIPALIITVHSIERMRYANRVKDLVSTLQRKVYAYTLNQAAEMGAMFVTHYEHHKDQLLSQIGNKYSTSVFMIPYPCPKLKTGRIIKRDSSGKKLLIYGQIREDKGIYEFLSTPGTEKLSITIAGPVVDERIFKFKNHNITFLNKYFNEDEPELMELVNSHSFMLLPYLKSYTGGSGTFKDSIAFGLPIIASAIPTFKEVINQGQVGFIFDKVTDIVRFCETTDDEQYASIASNCFKYAQQYNWDYMRQQYFTLYEQRLMMLKKNT